MENILILIKKKLKMNGIYKGKLVSRRNFMIYILKLVVQTDWYQLRYNFNGMKK